MRTRLTTMVALMAMAISYAGGFRVALQGQRALAMGHTGVAVVNNAETAFFNPAGMSFLEEKFTASFGANAIFSNIVFQNEAFGYSTAADNPLSTPFSLYGSYKINEKLSLGIAVYTPYGSSVEYPENWEGSHLVQDISLRAIFFQPTISYKISDKLSIGAGPIYVSGSVNFSRNLDRATTNTEGERLGVTIDQKGIGAWGYNAGVMFKANEKLTLGLNYRSEIVMEARGGDADFRNVPTFLQGQFADGTFDADLPLPAELSVGTSYQINDQWMVAFDYNRVFWNSYDALDVIFSNGLESINPRNYKDASSYRFGFQYKANETFTLRGGYYFDESPVQEGYFAPETPRNDSNNFTAGLSVQLSERFALDASFLYIHFSEIDASYDYYLENGVAAPFGGTYKNNAFIPGIGITYSL
ncbi:OmpP1/FadL family transporter [Robertkochia sediminum]|uniref:OmpP1/FadL family transporter n=1 Tax=Robertkochia sediminum TaxID=2785326 RepID=UPI001934550B|nr:outer membrane protein transport protein [Robertkochia sediminum]MBL7472405.1 outer membrane protein transport protein [Robertkochia sediminum]